MTDFPRNWIPARLGDLGTYINGMAFKPSDWTSDGLPIIRIQNLTDPNKPFNRFSGDFNSRYLIRDGDLLISWSASLGAYIWDRGDAILNQHIFRVAVNEDRVEKHFLYFLVLHMLDEIVRHTHGSTMKHITKRKFEALAVSVPSRHEQRRIVQQIQSVFERVREIEQLRQRSVAEAADLEAAIFLDSTLRHTRDGNIPFVPIGDVVTVNPKREKGIRSLCEDMEVSFVPMTAVDEVTGTIADALVKPLGAVRKGFTPFKQDDIIFAKITPCMQNGKSAVAHNLENGLGFGSTEFHVLRPGPDVLAEWLWYIVRQKSFRFEAQKHFRGSAGQQRVPASFIENYEIPLLSVEQQYRIVDRLQESLKRVNEICRSLKYNPVRIMGDRADRSSSISEMQELRQAVLRKAFAGEL